MKTIGRTMKVIVLSLMLVGIAPSAGLTLTTVSAATQDDVEAVKEELTQRLQEFKGLFYTFCRRVSIIYTKDEAPELYECISAYEYRIQITINNLEQATTQEELAEVQTAIDYVEVISVDDMKGALKEILQHIPESLGYLKEELDEKAGGDEFPELYEVFDYVERDFEGAYESLYQATTMADLFKVLDWFDKLKEGLIWLTCEIEDNIDVVSDTADGIRIRFRIISEEDKTVEVTGIGSHEENCTLTIPGTVEGYTVISIGEQAFLSSNIGTVVIPSSVTSIGENAFNNCYNLTSVSIPDFVTNIGKWAFRYCPLTSITIPKSVTTIGYGAFLSCNNLISVTVMTDTPLSIDSDVFSNRANATLFVPAGCKAAYKAADIWKDFKEVVEIDAPIETNIDFDYANVKAICVANWDTNEDGELSYDEAAAVTDLGEVFSENEEITSFNELQYFTGLTSIAREAFYGCVNLEEIMLPEGLTTIGEEAFSYCHISSLVLPESLIRICEQAFEGSYLTTITIPKNVAHLGSPEDEPGEEENIYASVFSGCHFLTAVNVDEENMVYASINGLLLTKDLKTLLYCPNGITGNVVIPEGTEYLRSTSFSEGLLTTVTLPVSLKYIDNFVFELCEQLTSVTAKMKRPCETSWDAFNSINTKATLYVPLGSKRNYEKANHWKEFKKIVEMGIEPLNEDEDVDFSNVGSDLAEETDLMGTVVNNMYYNIGTDAGGYSAEDGCIVITKETSDEQMEALEVLGITDEELKQNFTGIIFKVPAGKGKVTVTAETTGNMTLKVKVGNGKTMEMELSGKLKMKVPYNVSEESLVYIFAGTTDESASRGQQRASSGESSLRIYGIELEITLRGDVNGDTKVDAADVTALANYIVGNGTLANEAAADVNGDTKVDIADVTALIELIKNM